MVPELTSQNVMRSSCHRGSTRVARPRWCGRRRSSRRGAALGASVGSRTRSALIDHSLIPASSAGSTTIRRMERVLSVLTAYDVVAYLLSGSVLLGGVYWAIEGAPEKAPGAAAVLGLAVVAYVAGVVVAAATALSGEAARRVRALWYRKRRRRSDEHREDPVIAESASTNQHLWTRWFTHATDDKYFPPSVRRRLEVALGPFAVLETDAARAEIARVLIRQRGVDAWFERMLLSMWLTSYLSMTALLLVPSFSLQR